MLLKVDVKKQDAFERLWEEKKKIKRKCPVCQHNVTVETPKGFGICDYCGTKILSKKTEFKEKLRVKGVKE